MSATNINLLGRRLARCVDAAHEVYNACEVDDSHIGSLIIAAVILDGARPSVLPDYVNDLFLAAKAVCHDQESSLRFPRLAKALERFEDATVTGGCGDD
jgi:hypothetical protein